MEKAPAVHPLRRNTTTATSGLFHQFPRYIILFHSSAFVIPSWLVLWSQLVWLVTRDRKERAAGKLDHVRPRHGYGLPACRLRRWLFRLQDGLLQPRSSGTSQGAYYEEMGSSRSTPAARDHSLGSCRNGAMALCQPLDADEPSEGLQV